MATSLPESLAIFLLTTVLLQAARGQEIAQQHVVKEGDNVTMQWDFQIQVFDKVSLDEEDIIVQITLRGDVSIPADLKKSIQVTVGPGMSGLTVTLLSVTASQAGVYAYTGGGQALQKQLVIVQAKPDKPTITPIPGAFVVGGEKTLVCNSKSNSQPSNHSLPLTFTWSVTPPGGRQDGDSYVINPSPQDINKNFSFRCQAKELEMESEYSDPLSLTPECSPRRTNLPTEIFGVALGAHQTVEVNITAFPRDLTFSLHLDNTAVSPQPQLKTHLLPEPWKMTVSFNITIRNQTDYGTYKARFANAHGDMDVSFSVRRRGKPSPVEALTTTSITSSAVTLTWKDGFDGGLRQTFSVDYRPHGSQEWTEAVASISGSTATVENLEAGTMYHFRVHSHNELGRSVSVEVEATTVSGGNNLGLIIGVVIGVAVLIAVVIGVVIWKLRNKRPGPGEEVPNYAGLDSRTRHPPRDGALYQELHTYEVVQ